jgi:hypothetical protein
MRVGEFCVVVDEDGSRARGIGVCEELMAVGSSGDEDDKK